MRLPIVHLEIYIGPPRTEQAQRIGSLTRCLEGVRTALQVLTPGLLGHEQPPFRDLIKAIGQELNRG